jgi:hypothetical protein
MCSTFAALIGLTIMAIAELSGPYQGAINVSDAPFKFVLNLVDKNSMRAYAPDLGQPSATPSPPAH